MRPFFIGNPVAVRYRAWIDSSRQSQHQRLFLAIQIKPHHIVQLLKKRKNGKEKLVRRWGDGEKQ